MKLRDFSSALKLLQGLIPVGLISSAAIPSKLPLYFPPLGDHEPSHRLFAGIILGSAAFLPYFLPERTKRWRWLLAVVLFCAASTSAFVYSKMEDKLTTAVTFSPGETVNVTVGTERKPDLTYEDLPVESNPLLACAFKTDEALMMKFTKESLHKYLMGVLDSLSDRQLIKCSGGSDDEHLERIYEVDGLHGNRTKLYMFYLVPLLLFELLLGTIARSDDVHSVNKARRTPE